jgi:hypothetical protein
MYNLYTNGMRKIQVFLPIQMRHWAFQSFFPFLLSGSLPDLLGRRVGNENRALQSFLMGLRQGSC